MDSPNTKISSGNRSLVFVHRSSAKRIIPCRAENENQGISLTKQDFHLQNGTLGLQTGLSACYSPSALIIITFLVKIASF